MNRREFIALAGGCAGAAAVGTLQGCSSAPRYDGAIVDDRIQIAVAEFRTLAGEKRTLLVFAADLIDPVALLEYEDNRFRALSTTCTHQRCRVRPSKTVMRCPCHGSTYDLEGKVLRGPAMRALQQFRVDRDGDVLTIDVS